MAMSIDGGGQAWGAEATAEFSPEVFDYTPPERLEVREQSIRRPYALSGTRQEEIVFKDVRGQDVPVLITMPAEGSGPFPLVVLVHGYTSNKEEVTRQLGRVLTQRGMACIAMDLPHHGERPGKPNDMFPVRDHKQTYKNMLEAVIDVRQTIDFAESTPRVEDLGRRGPGRVLAGLMGRELTAAADRRIGTLALMVGGSAALARRSPATNSPGCPAGWTWYAIPHRCATTWP